MQWQHIRFLRLAHKNGQSSRLDAWLVPTSLLCSACIYIKAHCRQFGLFFAPPCIANILCCFITGVGCRSCSCYLLQDLFVLQIEQITISFDGGATTMNFTEAAMLIQGSACVYSKKVEYLYSLVFQVLGLLGSNKK